MIPKMIPMIFRIIIHRLPGPNLELCQTSMIELFLEIFQLLHSYLTGSKAFELVVLLQRTPIKIAECCCFTNLWLS